MAGVFLSYDRDDSAKARPIALALEKAGHSVWWDLHVRGGAQFSKVIEEALKAADAVVVLWSANSVESAWVRDEAAAGRDSGRLVPVTIDGTEPPLGFRQFQTIELSKWSGRGRPAQVAVLLQAISELASTEYDPGGTKPISATAAPQGRKRRLLIPIISVLVLLLGTATIVWTPWSQTAGAVVAVRAADQGANSRTLARDLLVQLGALRPVLSGSMRLVDNAGEVDRPDLLFQTASDSSGLSANLVLSDSKNEVLWSKQFDDPNTKPADRRQQLAFTAARVLRCALDESSGKYGHLENDMRQAFLNACAAAGEIGWDTRPILAPLRTVTQSAPGFRPAWAQLLIADANAASFAGGTTDSPQVIAALKQDLSNVRKRFPDLAEATVAEYYASPHLRLTDAVALLDKAKSQDPDNPAVLGEHSTLMASVGRVQESVDDAERASKLDPLSPYVRMNFIRALAYAGRIDEARAELARATQIWPSTDVVKQAKYSVELRYGDFEKAIIESGENYNEVGFRSYVAARKNPSRENVARFVALVDKFNDSSHLGFGVQALGEMDKVDEIYDLLAKNPVEAFFKGQTYILFRPWLAIARRDTRFMIVAKRLGLTAYWQQSGIWPDFCREPDLPYDCEKEAAKLK